MSNPKKKIYATITSDRITVTIDNRQRSFLMASDQGKKLADAVREDPQDHDKIRQIADIASFIAAHTFGRVILDTNDRLRLDGREVDYGVAHVIRRMIHEDFDPLPLTAFLENVAENPDETIAAGLYPFLEKGNHSITPDGWVLAYKRVSDEYTSFTRGREVAMITPAQGEPYSATGLVPYPLGATVSLDRGDCDPSQGTACSRGLHLCSFDYLMQFHGGVGRILICKVHPRDITAFPNAYEAKLRCCSVQVIDEIPEAEAEKYFTKMVDRRYPVAPPIEPLEAPLGETDLVGQVEAGMDVSEAPEDFWYAAGYSQGDEHASADIGDGAAYGMAPEYPDNIPGDQRQKFTAAYAEAYDHRWNIGLEPASAPEPEGHDDEVTEQFIEEDEDPPLTPESVKTLGYDDGFEWARGDTLFDANPTQGASYAAVKATEDAALMSGYRMGFAEGYTDKFSEENPDES